MTEISIIPRIEEAKHRMQSCQLIYLLLIWCSLMLAYMPSLLCAEKVDFSRDISPILSDRCFACHGPDAKGRKARLRFDIETDLKRDADSGFSILKSGDAENSEIFRRIISTDPDEVMPPPEFLVPVSDTEKALIKRWIEEGAEWS